jgi:group I intron endonuclease
MYNNDMFVYQVKNTLNGKRYVGFTKRTLEQRFKEHKAAAAVGLKQPLYSAIRKHGHKNFEMSVLEVCTDEVQMREREIYWIAELGTFGNGYNATKDGDGVLGLKHTAETKLKMSEARMGDKNHNFGKHWGFKWIDHPEQLKKLSEARTGEGNPMSGKHHTAEARAKITAALKKRIRKTIPVNQCDKDGNILNTYSSVRAAALAVNGRGDKILICCKGLRKTHAKFKWTYA